MALDRNGNPVCRVEWPHNDAPALWGGTHGNAKVVRGDEAVAVTADGVRHAL